MFTNILNTITTGHKQQESEKLNIEILISPTVAKLTQTLKLFLGISYEYRQIIFAGTQFKVHIYIYLNFCSYIQFIYFSKLRF